MILVTLLFVGPPVTTIPAGVFALGLVFCLGMVGVLAVVKRRRP